MHKTPILRITEETLFHKCFEILAKLRLPKFRNIKGPKKYEFKIKLAFLLFKVLSQKTYREAVTYSFDHKQPHFTTLQKFTEQMSLYLQTQLLKATKLLLNSFNSEKVLCAIDGTGLSKSRASKHYEKRVGIQRDYRYFDKLSILIDCETKLILGWHLRVKPAHDVKDIKYLLPRAKGYKYILLDKGYSAEWIYEECFYRNLIPQIPFKTNAKRGHFRKKLGKLFRKHIYNMRSIIECVYSILKRKFGEVLSSRKLKTKQIELALKIFAYNIEKISNIFLQIFYFYYYFEFLAQNIIF